MRNGRCRGMLFAIALAGTCMCIRQSPAAIQVSSGTATITHDRDLLTDDQLVTFTSVTPLLLTDINPPVDSRYDNLGYGGSYRNYSSAHYGVGYLINNTTAGLALRLNSGLEVIDPDRVFAGPSSLKYDVDYWWTVPAATQFGPFANGFGAFIVNGSVGAAGSAQLLANLTFKNQNGVDLRAPWVINQSWGPGSFSQTISTARPLMAPGAAQGVLPANSKLHISGSIELRVSDDGDYTALAISNSDISAAPVSGIAKPRPGQTMVWTDLTAWESPPSAQDTGIVRAPNGVGYRALFADAATVSLPSPVTLGTLDVSTQYSLNLMGPGPLRFQNQPGGGNAVLNLRTRDSWASFNVPVELASTLDVMSAELKTGLASQNRVGFAGDISGSGGINLFGSGILELRGNNTYSGGTKIYGGRLYISSSSISGTDSGDVIVGKTSNTLGGSLFISGPIAGRVVMNGGSVSLGDDVNTITVGGLTLTGAGALTMKGGPAGFDRVNVTGVDTFNVIGTEAIMLREQGAINPGDYVVIDYNGAPAGSVNNLYFDSLMIGGYVTSLVHDTANTNVVLRLTKPPEWNLSGVGSWGNAANWSPTGPPATVAWLTNKITAPSTVTLDGDRSLDMLKLDSSQPYTIAAGSGGSLIIGDSRYYGTVTVSSGAHQIAAPVVINASSTNIDIAAGSELRLTGPLIVNDKIFAKNGAGTLTISGPQTYRGYPWLVVWDGVLNLNSNAGPGVGFEGLALTAAAAGRVVLGTDQVLRGLQVDHDNDHDAGLDLNSPAGAGQYRLVTVAHAVLPYDRDQLWLALMKANAPDAKPGVGIFDSNLHPLSRIGMAILNGQIVIRPTRIGDLNLDGMVSISDFVDLAANFGKSSVTWQEGDLNYDGSVTIADLIDLAANFNTSYAGESWPIGAADAKTLADFAAKNVPEPGLLGLCAVTLVLSVRRSVRKCTPSSAGR